MDNAFEKARAAYGTGTYDDTTLEFLFPQLKESEEERIRKDLIGGLMWQRDNIGRLGPHDDNLILPGFCENVGKHLSWLEKQQEQKPVNVDYISGIREELLGIENNARNIDGLTESQWVAIRAAHRLLGEYIEKEQKPWKVGANAYFTPEQKPAEWSEEDEDMLNSCISSIEEAKENRYAYKETDGDTSYDHEIAWLKSLRPSWKPSEEQMEALKHTAEWKKYSDPQLFSLYEHLKKLKGQEEPEYYQHFDPDC